MASDEFSVGASAKTNLTAAVIIPPGEVWRPIQTIRARYDRKFARWMPHVTLLYPFRPKEEFEALAEQFSAACADIQPFEVELSEFHSFDHGRESFTLWLALNPPEPVVALQAALARVTPDCNDPAQFETGFTPHLSVGQARGEPAMSSLRDSLQARWKPLKFPVNEISLIWREETPPEDAFRVGCKVRLGQRAAE